MITLTHMNGKTFVLNAEVIETVERTPDTVITLINGKKLVVKEDVEEVINKVIEYKRRIFEILLEKREG
ncbi:MAG: endoflagellar protein [Thermotoga sp.]|nr:MAG: endoflagellar protein [Thermotoga sp.]HDM70909.1 endoflagellar protein [Thermotogales bacterium]